MTCSAPARGSAPGSRYVAPWCRADSLRHLFEAKAQHPGTFVAWLDAEPFGFSRPQAYRLMSLGESFSRLSTLRNLPPDRTALYELARLKPPPATMTRTRRAARFRVSATPSELLALIGRGTAPHAEHFWALKREGQALGPHGALDADGERSSLADAEPRHEALDVTASTRSSTHPRGAREQVGERRRLVIVGRHKPLDNLDRHRLDRDHCNRKDMAQLVVVGGHPVGTVGRRRGVDPRPGLAFSQVDSRPLGTTLLVSDP
jgi:hypothetical protein